MPVSPQHLKTSELFEGFTDAGIGILSQIAKLREVPQGLSIFLEDSPGDSLFLILSGTVEIHSGGAAAAKLLCLLTKGDHFGDMALLRPGRRQASAKARTPCQLVEIKRNDFNELMKSKPQACLKLMLAVMTTVEKRLQEAAPLLRELA